MENEKPLQDLKLIKSFICKRVPIRATKIEKQTLKELAVAPYAEYFLEDKVREKVIKTTEKIEQEWSIKDIEKRNVFANIADDCIYSQEDFQEIMTIIELGMGLRCTNNGRKRDIVFPIKIEYSMTENQFRVCAYSPSEDRFIKMNLDRMKDIQSVNEFCKEYLNLKYSDAMSKKCREVVLEVSSDRFIIERCFRLFSYYEREALYDRDSEKYLLKIRFNEADSRAELVRDILSLGGYVIVIEPEDIREQIIRRIKGAIALYK